jgi:ribosome-associated translation inhibitor RaiA
MYAAIDALADKLTRRVRERKERGRARRAAAPRRAALVPAL